MKKLLYGLIAVVVVAIGAALIVPGFIDWNKYKPEIIAQVAKATGRTLAIDGSINLGVLPSPTLSVRDVRLSNIAGASSADMVTLNALDVRVALMPLLTGEVQVESVTIVQPVIELERLPDGRVNWTLAAESGADPASPAPEAPAASAASAETGGIPIALDRFEIEDGLVVYRDGVGGVVETVSDINAVVSALSLQGPFSIDGSVTVRELPLRLSASIGELRGGQAVPLKLDVGGEGVKASGAGNLQMGDAPTFVGTVRLDADSVGALFAMAGTATQQPLEAPFQAQAPFSLRAQVDYAPTLAAAEDIELRIGDAVAGGRVGVGLDDDRRVDAALTVNRLDLDALLVPDPGAAESVAPEAPSQTVTTDPDNPVIDPADPSGEAPLVPVDIRGSIDLAADAIVYRGQIIRQAVVNIGLVGGTVNVQRMSALLPGGSDVTVFGTIAAKDGVPHFTGQVDAASDNLRGLLEWVDVNVAAVPADRLRKIDLTAQIDGSSRAGQVTDLDLQFDATRVVGGMAYALRERPGVGMNLRIDQLNADAYLPPIAAAPPTDQAGPPAGDQTDGEVDDGGAAPPPPGAASRNGALGALAAVDADIVMRIDQLTYRGLPMRDLVVDGLLQNGALNLREVGVADIAGAGLSVAGSLTDLAATPHVDGTVRFATDDIAGFARAFPELGALPPALTGAVGLDFAAKGGFDSIAVDGTLEALESALSLAGTVSDPMATRGFDLEAEFENPNLARLLAAVSDFDADAAPPALAGPVNLALGAVGEVAGFDLNASLGLADADLSVGGRFDEIMSAANFDLTAKLAHPNLANLLASFSALAAPDAAAGLQDPMNVSLVAKGALRGFDFSADMALADLSGDFKGRIDGLPEAATYTMDAEIDHPRLTELLASFGVAESGAAFQGPLRVTGRVDGNPTLTSVPNLTVALGQSSIVGSASFATDGARPKFSADFIAGEIVAEHFMAPAAAGTEGTSTAPSVDTATAPTAEAATETQERWSRDPIDLAAMRAYDADIKLSADALSVSGYRFENANLALTLVDGLLDVSRLTGQAFDGDIDLRAKLDGRAVPAMSLAFDVQGANIEALLQQAAQVDNITGIVDLNANVEGSGRSQYELVSSLTGGGRLGNTVPGIIRGLDLRALSDQLDDLDKVGDFLNLAKISFDGGETAYSQLSGTFAMQDGVLNADDMQLVADGGNGTVQGLVNLPRWTLDLGAMFQLPDHPEAPPIGVQLTGPINQPNRDVKTAEMEQYLVARGVGSVLRNLGEDEDLGGAGALIEELIGGGVSGQAQPAPVPPADNAAQPAAPQAEPEQPPETAEAPAPTLPEPEEAFRSILDNLLSQ